MFPYGGPGLRDPLYQARRDGRCFSRTVDDEAEGIISYTVSEGDIDQAGHWRFWAWVRFTGDQCAPGEVQKVFIRREGR